MSTVKGDAPLDGLEGHHVDLCCHIDNGTGIFTVILHVLLHVTVEYTIYTVLDGNEPLHTTNNQLQIDGKSNSEEFSYRFRTKHTFSFRSQAHDQ